LLQCITYNSAKKSNLDCRDPSVNFGCTEALDSRAAGLVNRRDIGIAVAVSPKGGTILL